MGSRFVSLQFNIISTSTLNPDLGEPRGVLTYISPLAPLGIGMLRGWRGANALSIPRQRDAKLNELPLLPLLLLLLLLLYVLITYL